MKAIRLFIDLSRIIHSISSSKISQVEMVISLNWVWPEEFPGTHKTKLWIIAFWLFCPYVTKSTMAKLLHGFDLATREPKKNTSKKNGDGEGPSGWDKLFYDDGMPIEALPTGWFNKKGRSLTYLLIDLTRNVHLNLTKNYLPFRFRSF